MYCQHFNLAKKPFQISSDNQFLWLGKKHASALELLKQGIAQKQGLLVLTGDVGTGKTTLINEIIHTLDAKTRPVVIADSCFEMHHLFLTIAQAFGFEDQYQKDKNFSAQFVSFLRTENTRGRKALVIIDEAQRIPERFLKEIISWSGFGFNQVLTVILAGQLEFQNILEKNLGQGWRDHIQHHAFLEPLDENETKIYINKRLEFSGSKRKIFLISAIHEVHVYSKGFPRKINIACDQTLIAAFAKGMRLVDVPTFKEAMGQLDLPTILPGEKDVHSGETIPSQGAWLQRKSMIGGAVFVLICLFAGLYYGENGPFPFKKESLAPPDLISLENQLQKPKLPAVSDPLNGLEQIPPPKIIELAAPQVQEPEDENEDQNIDIAYTPASSMEDKEDPSPVLIDNFMETDLTIEKPPLPGSAEPFEENPVDDYPVLNEPEPEPDAIIDWLIHKRETE